MASIFQRISFLLLLFWPCDQVLASSDQYAETSKSGMTSSNENRETSDKKDPVKQNDQSPRKGETIWLEEKISPSTRWLEGLVKPMTTWMEGKIQKHPDQKIQPTTRETPGPEKQNLNGSPEQGGLIDPDTVAQIASQKIPGQILRMKLLERNPLQYRIKLISKAGEIHMLYINAHTGELIQPSIKPTEE